LHALPFYGGMASDFILPLALGLGLAAAVGFRVFLPLFLLGLAARLGLVSPFAGFEWVASTPALIMFAVAAVTEIGAYFVPLLDNALDHLAGPIAVAAGIGVTALALGDVPPMLKWTLAIIAGGGVAAATQGSTTLLRGASTTLTAGLGNHAVATGEILGAIFFSLAALFLPYLALALVALMLVAGLRLFFKRRMAPKEMAPKEMAHKE
jgi:hypothetical protein